MPGSDTSDDNLHGDGKEVVVLQVSGFPAMVA